MKLISKIVYLNYLECPGDAWLKLNNPDLHCKFELSAFERGLLRQGNEVERVAQKLFDGGIEISEADAAVAEFLTQKHIEQKTAILFQPTFVANNFVTRVDVLKYDPSANAWNIYEIKGKNSLQEDLAEVDHIEDVSFQFAVLTASNLKIGKCFVVHLNKEYILTDFLNISQLFNIEDVTEKVVSRQWATKQKMCLAKELLLQHSPPVSICSCIYKGRSAHCTSFKHFHGDVPDYSIHDIARIGSSQEKLKKLVEEKIFSLEDIPQDFELTPIRKNQIDVHRRQQPIIDKDAIVNELQKLVFPLYFLDYETYAPAIPKFFGFGPYERIPFQCSLHVLHDSGAEPSHFEYLHELGSDPSQALIAFLQRNIGDVGTVIVWNKVFERGINQEMGVRNAEAKQFFADLNSRMYDLMDVFSKQYYVHHNFKGKTSLKYVAPALINDINYDDLKVRDGGTASEQWYSMVYGNLTVLEKQNVAWALRKYCWMDTFAMYKIWRFLHNSVSCL